MWAFSQYVAPAALPPSLHPATVALPLLVHLAMFAIVMFLFGLASGSLDNGMLMTDTE